MTSASSIDLPRKRLTRWFRFSLRTLFLFLTAFAIYFGLYMKRARDRKAAILAIERLDGALGFKLSGLPWMRELIGDEKCFWDPAGVHFDRSGHVTDNALQLVIGHLESFQRLQHMTLAGSQVTDTGVAHLKLLSKLTWLNLNDTEVSDVGLNHLKNLRSLTDLRVANTAVTDAGIANLQKALPNCKVQR